MSDHFQPVDVGLAGRRAVAYLFDNGVFVAATDANVAGHALSAMLEALQKDDRPIGRWAQWTRDLLKEFPARPDATQSMVEHERGQVDVNFNTAGVAYAYVKPAAEGHENGGALFHWKNHTVTTFQHTVYLMDDAISH